MGKLLTIAISTYNRANYLEETLDILVPQVKPYEDCIDFVISDNGSCDNTSEVVEKYKELVSIKFTRNPQNIGSHQNFINLVHNSESEYIILMGDDDIIAPGFVSIIINLLKEGNEYSIIHWNRLSGDENCNNSVLVDKVYETVEWRGTPTEFVSKILDKANFISSIVFNKNCWILGEPYSKDEYDGYEWFARLYWGALLFGKECVYYYFPLVVQRNPSKSWAQYWPKYYIGSTSNIFLDLDEKVPGVYEKWRFELKKGIPDCIVLVGKYRKYYSGSSIKKELLKHLDQLDKIKYYYYLIPGTYALHVLRTKTSHIIHKLLS